MTMLAFVSYLYTWRQELVIKQGNANICFNLCFYMYIAASRLIGYFHILLKIFTKLL